MNEIYDFTENKIIEGNERISYVDRVIKETGKVFDDKAHIITCDWDYRIKRL